jgi:hypothetical protein
MLLRLSQFASCLPTRRTIVPAELNWIHELTHPRSRTAMPCEQVDQLHSMNEFDPSQPAILHDRSTDRIETWTGEYAADYREHAVLGSDGTVQWRDFVCDGWGHVLGG